MSYSAPPPFPAMNVVPDDASIMMRYDANKRSVIVAYLLWFFLGYLGAHRFYLARYVSGTIMLLLTGVSTLLLVIFIGGAGYFLVGLWWLLDAVLIPGMASGYNNALIERLRRGG